MLNRKIFNICVPELKFFVANVANMDDPIADANIDKIQNRNYHFGILLQGSRTNIDRLSTKLRMPMYSTLEEEYYVLDVVHRLYTPKLVRRLYRFIFIDIESLSKGLVEDRPSTVESTRVSDKLMKGSNISDFKKISRFVCWLTSLFVNKEMADEFFIVTDRTPFYYLQTEPDNMYIDCFFEMIAKYMGNNFYYLSTDGDYYYDIYLCKGSGLNEISESNINLVLAGTIGGISNEPVVFRESYREFYHQMQSHCRESSDVSGYLSMTINNKSVHASYIQLELEELTYHVVHHVLRLVECHKYTPLSDTDKDALRKYIRFTVENNFINLYKRLMLSASGSSNILRTKLIDSLLVEAEYILR